MDRTCELSDEISRSVTNSGSLSNEKEAVSLHPKQNSGPIDHFEQAFHFITPGFPECGPNHLKPFAIQQVEMVQQVFCIVEFGKIHLWKHIHQCWKGFDKTVVSARMNFVVRV